MYVEPGEAMSFGQAGDQPGSTILSATLETHAVKLVLAIFIFAAWSATAAFGQSSSEDETLAEMFRHDLASSAARYVEANLARSDLSASQRALWTMRLLECRAQVALRGSEATLWEQCTKLYEEFNAAQSANPRLPWITWQYARCLLLRSQANLARYVAAPANEQPRQEALELVRDIVRLTDSLEDDIKRRQPLAARQGASGGAEAPAEQLDQLRVESGLLRCESLLVRAKLYPKGSKDRVAATTEVEKQASEILKTTSKNWASRSPLLIAQATAMLELGQRTNGLQILAKILLDNGKGSRLSQKAAIVAIDELTKSDEPSRASQLISYIDASTVEYRLANLQVSLADARRLAESQRQDELGRLVGVANEIGKEFGSYWRNRAEALLLGEGRTVGESEASPGNLDVMLAEIRQLLAASKDDEAVSRILEFRDNAVATKQAANALQLAKLASTLLGNQQQKWDAAAVVLEETCKAFPESPEAAETHARAVAARAEQLRASPNDSQAEQAYEAALNRQLKSWPDSEITDESQQWLTRWLKSRNRIAELLTALLGRASHSQNPETVSRVLQNWLGSFCELGEQEQEDTAIAELEELLSATGVPAGEVGAKTVLIAAETMKRWPTGDNVREVEVQLDSLLRLKPGPSHALLLGLEILHETRQRDLRSAESHVRVWKPDTLQVETQNLLSSALIQALAEIPAGQRGRWIRTIAKPEWSQSLSKSPFVRQRASGFRLALWQGDVSNSLSGLSQLVKENPRNGWLLLELGAALADSGKNRLGDSTRLVRNVAATSRPGSELFLAARWQWVKNLLAAGDKQKAIQTSKLVLASPISIPIYESRFSSVE